MLKKNIILILALVFMGLSATVANAQSGKCGTNLNWSYNSSTKVLTITGTGDMNNYTSSTLPWYSFRFSITSISLPDGITSIGNYAFRNCSGLTSVTIPDSVTLIGVSAFRDCSSLTSVTIPNSVTSISDYAFEFCRSLTSVTIPDSVTSIGVSAFDYCSSLTSVTIPNSVTSIGDDAFASCSGLTSVTIPNSVTSIGKSTFWLCSSLTSVTIPNSVTSIGDRAFSSSGLTSVTIPNSVTSIGETAFWNCTDLTSVTISNSVTSIGDRAFGYCSSLTAFIVTEDNPNYSSIDGILYDKQQTTLILCPEGKTGTVTIPDSVTSIEDFAFQMCSGLTSVTIPNSVTSIGGGTFVDCSGLTSVTIPNSVTSIGRSAFFYCTSLTSITIPNSVTSIGGGAFSGCSSLTSITVLNPVPVEITTGVFPADCTLKVPAIAVSDYKNADVWKKFNIKATPCLTDLTVSAGTLFPEFNPDKFIYRITVSKCTENIILAATPESEDATVSGDGQKELNLGENTFEITVSTSNGNSTYTVIITRMSDDYSLEFLRGSEITTGNTTVTYRDMVINKDVTVPVIDLYELEYVLLTGDFSGTIPLHFDIEDGRYTYNKTVNAEANSIYKFSLYMEIKTAQGDIIFRTNYDVYGRPSSTTAVYEHRFCNVTASNGNESLSAYEFNITGSSIPTISTSDLTFVGNGTICETTGIASVKGTDKLKIYPNPTTGIVYTETEGDIKVYNLQGKLLQSTFGSQVDLSVCPKGLYLLQVNGVWVKVVKE